MMLAYLPFTALIIGLSWAGPCPQEEISLEEVNSKASNSQRYGADVGTLDPEALKEVFGIDPEEEPKTNDINSGVPKDIVIDDHFNQCSSYNESGFSCVLYYACEDSTIIIDGAGLFNPRFGGIDDVELNPTTSKCPGSLEMCCRHPDFEGLPIIAPVVGSSTSQPITKPVTPEVDNTYTDTEEENNSDRDSESPYVQPIQPQPDTPAYQPRCGQRNYNGVGVRIQQSVEEGNTQFGEWPHMCAVLKKTIIGETEHALYVGGSSLIAPNVVLTGAHIVDELDYQTVTVRCGEWDTQREIEPRIHQDRRARDIILHPGFNKRNQVNNFAIIVLEEPFELDKHIDTICLPDPYNHFSHSWTDCVATGWGKDRFGQEGEYQVIMKKVALDMMPHAECEATLKNTTRLGRFFKLDKSFSCAGGEEGKDTCTGDGGGPLVCYNDNTDSYEQSGIITKGLECGKAGIPGVYANVSTGLCFIDWATRCSLGQEVDHYGLSGCKRWAKRTYCELLESSDILQDLLASTTDLRTKGKLFRQNKLVQAQLETFAEAALGCPTGNQNIDCNVFDYLEDADYTDVSVHAKISDDDEDQNDADDHDDDSAEDVVDPRDSIAIIEERTIQE